MRVQLPTTGCNVYYGNYIDNYASGVRSRYYLNDGNLVLSTQTNYNSQPMGANCITELSYKPEFDYGLKLVAGLSAIVIAFMAIKLVIGRALR